MKIKQFIAVFVLVFVLAFNLISPSVVFSLKASIFNDATASAWAIPELTQAYDYGLTYPDIMGKFQQPITREEFCIIVVKLYTKLTNKTVNAEGAPFSDTNNPEIIKAYQLGIVNGTGGGKFSPSLSITRQEIATMIYRALSKSYSELPPVDTSNFPFKDKGKIASWALNGMIFAYQNGIMKGITLDTIDPLSNTTREQGIVLVKRTYENFRASINAKLRLIKPPVSKSELDKFKSLDFKALINEPLYDTRLILYVATDSEKPLSKPTDKIQVLKGSVYTKADNGAFIDINGNKVRYFFADYGTIIPNALVWQVSRAPFTGFKTNWKNPLGLVGTGTISPPTKEFTIDFSKFAPLTRIILNQNTLTTGTQQIYFVRAVPVDKNMECIGDPGKGIRVVYGTRSVSNPQTTLVTLNGKKVFIKKTFEIWTTMRDGPITCNGEFPNKLQHLSEVGFNTLDTSKWFQCKNFPDNTTKIVLQVSSKPYNANDPVERPSGLVYSKTFTPPIPAVACIGTENSVELKFHDFAPADSTLKAGDSIPYYIRGVAYSRSSTAGADDYVISEVVKVNYYKQQEITIYQWKTVSVPTYIPDVSIVHYEPTQWQDPNWAHYYVVYRYPRWNELNFMVTNGTDTLYPYFYYYLKDKSMTPERYEKEILWKWLSPGTRLSIWDKEEDKSFWEALWDGIVSFFKSPFEIIAKITNWVASSYNKFKTAIIVAIAENIPGIPDSYRNSLKTALTALVDYGLASLGIPPNLPNFDELEKEGLGYLAREALTEGGIPVTQMTVDMVSDTAKAIGNGLVEAANSATPNPLNCPFIKADTSYFYRPAYLDIKITNNYDKPSIVGKLNVDVNWDWHEWQADGQSSILLENSVFNDLPPGVQFQSAIDYRNHFLYGLKKGYSYYPVYYPVFEPMRDISIPILQPHESVTLRVYLKEYVDKPYAFAPQGEVVTWDDFANLYGMQGNVGPVKFKVYTDGFTLPTLPKNSYDDKTHTISIYAYDRTSTSSSFEGVPKNPH